MSRPLPDCERRKTMIGVPTDIADRLRIIARLEDRTMTAIMRRALEVYLPQIETKHKIRSTSTT